MTAGDRNSAIPDGTIPDGTIPMRPGEGLPVQAVRDYLAEHLAGFPAGDPFQIRQFPAGASNLTYLLRSAEWEAVLRRPPFGPLPPKAHDMKRESSILRLLHARFPLAPRPYLFCEDPAVIGAPFYVMERRRGVVLDSAFPPGSTAEPADCRRISELVVDTLVELHAVDHHEAGLAEFGHPEGFLERQVRGWLGRYERAKTDDVPDVERLGRWLIEKLPASPAPSVIHNDFKLNNLLLTQDMKQVTAVLDWEMATIGDPLFDLGVTLSYWHQADDPEILRQVLPTVTVTPGFYTRDEFIQSYAAKTGRDVANIGYYLTLAYFKLAVILQQIYFRWREGQTQDERFGGFGRSVTNLISLAADRAGLRAG